MVVKIFNSRASQDEVEHVQCLCACEGKSYFVNALVDGLGQIRGFSDAPAME